MADSVSNTNKNPSRRRKRSPVARPVSELVGTVLEPVLARRAGMTLDLLRAWPELAGEEFRHKTRPEKIDWPKRVHDDDPFQPATLVVACDSASALFFLHEQPAILERVNLFFGFQAIRRIRIVQKPVETAPASKTPDAMKLSKEEEVRLSTMLEAIHDPDLKKTLSRLGRGILTRNRSK